MLFTLSTFYIYVFSVFKVRPIVAPNFSQHIIIEIHGCDTLSLCLILHWIDPWDISPKLVPHLVHHRAHLYICVHV